MKLHLYGSDFSSCSESDVPGFVSLGSSKGVAARKQYLLALGAHPRQGIACTNDRCDFSDTGKKPYGQRGTGIARHRSKWRPIWAGDRVVVRPKSCDYSQKVNGEVKNLAIVRALSDKALE
jgi:large subunit ribosomal protein L4